MTPGNDSSDEIKICEGCGDQIAKSDPRIVKAREVLPSVEGAAELLIGRGVHFHAPHFPTGSPRYWRVETFE
jgi:hypothetical protein